MDSLYTKLRTVQFRGPSTSDDYNDRIEENYRDLVAIKNEILNLSEDVRESFSRLVKEHTSVTQFVSDLESRLDSIETNSMKSSLFDPNQVENDRFDNTPYAISSTARLTLDGLHGILTLPKVDSSSVSRLTFIDANGESRLPSSIDTRVVGAAGSADDGSAVIDTSDPQLALLKSVGRIWERNVITNATNSDGARMTLYVKVPTDLFTTDKSNVILVHPFPSFSVEIEEIAVSTKAEIFLDDSDGYTPLNATAIHDGNEMAVGWVPPGGWPGDTIFQAGPKAFYFDPLPVNGVRLKLRQRNNYHEAGRYIYSYGLSDLDIRYDKFLTTGKAMVKIDPPGGTTISSIDNVQPLLFNVSESQQEDVFSYRVIWETSYNSGVYTTTPVANSLRVWVEVTLNLTPGMGTPALSGLSLTYS